MGKRILRVFPSRTSMTPTDPLAFVGEPPLFRPEVGDVDEVHISVTFTWDVEEGHRLRDAWAQHYAIVKIGGPAIDTEPPGEFIPGLYVKSGVTITSRGCPRRCPWCFVPKREGAVRELEIKPGWIVQDNNLLATSRGHQERVFEMLRTQERLVSFPGGLDSRLIDDWTTDQLRTLTIGQVFFAADSEAGLGNLEGIRERLSFLSRRQLRCYVLIGFGGESYEKARARLEAVWGMGFMPFAQLYRDTMHNTAHRIRYSTEWRALARLWSRPAAMIACQGDDDDTTTRPADTRQAQRAGMHVRSRAEVQAGQAGVLAREAGGAGD